MKYGIADYGMNVWDGGLYDIELRLEELRDIGFNGTERLEAISASDALTKAARYRKMGMDFATCRGRPSGGRPRRLRRRRRCAGRAGVRL